MSAGRASLALSAYPDLAETVIFMSGRSSIFAARRSGMEAGGGADLAIEVKKALRYMCTYSSCPLLNLEKIQQVLQIVSLAQTSI